ncbi:MAG: pyrroline-5-carboxylate reductase [Pirellulaceae bacterium]
MADELVGFIGGGQMASALAAGALQAQVFTAQQLVFAEPSIVQQEKLLKDFSGATIVDSGTEALRMCQRVVLAVKPYILKDIAAELAGAVTAEHLLVSIVAGISLVDLQANLNTKRIVRVMPNTPAQVGMGAAAISADNAIDKADIAWVERLMNAVGISVRVQDDLMHAVTGIAGSSPAYIYLIIEALSDGGVAMGLPRETATRLAAQAVAGSAQMVLQTGLHPGVLKDQVTSPGGTTMAALRELEAAGVRSAFMEAVARCVERSMELAD